MLKIDSDFTVFLDRDGVINERIPDDYVKKITDFHFCENALQAIVKLSKRVKYIFVVTNQQGIGKGVMTERNLLDVHNYMLQKVEENGGKITDCFHAPNLAAENSNMRKPNTGMASLAMKNYKEINLKKAIIIGDSDSDILFGKNLGIGTVRILGLDKPTIDADFTFNSLNEFVENLEK